MGRELNTFAFYNLQQDLKLSVLGLNLQKAPEVCEIGSCPI